MMRVEGFAEGRKSGPNWPRKCPRTEARGSDTTEPAPENAAGMTANEGVAVAEEKSGTGAGRQWATHLSPPKRFVADTVLRGKMVNGLGSHRRR